MDISAYFAIIVVVGMIAALAMDIASADFILFVALSSFLLTGIVTPGEALAGFSNRGMLTVAVLFIVSYGVQNTGALESIAGFFLGRNKKSGVSALMLKMMAPVTCMSAFLNNTPIVVMLVPAIKKWANRMDLSSSKFLIPLSYAAMFGGVCTLIGTSTNLVVHGLMLDNNMDGISMFELARIGIPCALAGWLYMAFIGKRILPDRKDMVEVIGENSREYMIEMKVGKDYGFTGKSISDAGLRNLKGVFLIDIEREGQRLGPVSHEEIIREGDILLFVGVTSAVVDLYDTKGLEPVEKSKVDKMFGSKQMHMIEAVISSNSPVVGMTVKECSFRERYDAGVIAVHRNGQRIEVKVGSIKLKEGDTLLLLTRPDFEMMWKNSQDFYLISSVKEIRPRMYHKAYIALAIVALMVIGATVGRYLPKLGGVRIGMLHTAFAAAILMVATRCARYSEARNSIRWDVLITIACAFGISRALQKSGAAGSIAGFVINMVKGMGPVGVLAAVYLMTTVFTEIITNNAAAALVFPIAYSASMQLGVDPKPFFIAIAIAASASFATPIGYQTNLIVQGAGGYRFSDYVKVGLPLNILFFVLSILLIPVFWQF